MYIVKVKKRKDLKILIKSMINLKDNLKVN